MAKYASILTIVAIFFGTQLCLTAIRIRKYIKLAQLSGIPYTWSPVNELGVVAFFTDVVLRWYYREYLQQGKGWPRWARFMIKDWQYEDHRRATLEYGDTFLIVTPTGLVCHTSDPDVVSNVLGHRKAFVKSTDKMELLVPFGPNVVSVEGDLWKFHLAVTLPPLAADSVARLVWDETARQVGMMATAWRPEDSHRERIYALTMNTMSLVGFGHQAEWGGKDVRENLPPGHRYSLVGAMNGVISHLPQIMLLPRWSLRWPWPAAYRASNEMESYVEEMLAQERERLKCDTKEAQRENLLTAVVRSNLVAEKKKVVNSLGRTSLNDEEIKGNVFIFLLAGYETTAITFFLSTLVLVASKDLENQVLKEIDAIYAQAAQEGRSELSYTHDFPRFRYVVAFMYEVMRVFPIVQAITRVVAGKQDLRVGNDLCNLPGGSSIVSNHTSIHFDPNTWPSPEVIEPRRWLVADPHGLDPTKPLTSSQEAEIHDGKVPIPSHRKGTFMSFGEGPRACLGRSFARVEFVAIMAPLLRHHRLEMNSSDPDAAARVLRTARLRSSGSPITLNPPEDVQIKLVKRS